MKLTLGITKGINDLVKSELAVLHTRPVVAHTFHHELLVLFRETLGLHRGVGHPPYHEEAPADGKTAVEDEQGLPLRNGGRLGDLREQEGHKSADDLLQPVHHVPEHDGGRLLLALVPHAREESEGGLADSLEGTEKGSHSHETGEVAAGGHEGDGDAPADNVSSKPFGNGDALDDPILGIFDKQHDEVNDGCEPGVLERCQSMDAQSGPRAR